MLIVLCFFIAQNLNSNIKLSIYKTHKTKHLRRVNYSKDLRKNRHIGKAEHND